MNVRWVCWAGLRSGFVISGWIEATIKVSQEHLAVIVCHATAVDAVVNAHIHTALSTHTSWVTAARTTTSTAAVCLYRMYCCCDIHYSQTSVYSCYGTSCYVGSQSLKHSSICFGPGLSFSNIFNMTASIFSVTVCCSPVLAGTIGTFSIHLLHCSLQ